MAEDKTQTPQERLAEVEKAIDGQMKQLHALGVAVPDYALIGLKLDCFIQATLTPEQQADFDVFFAESMVSMLANTLEEVHKQQNAFIKPDKRLIVPGG